MLRVKIFFIIIFLLINNASADEGNIKISLNLNIEGYPIYINDVEKKIIKNNSNFNLFELLSPVLKKNFSSRDYKKNNQLFYIKMKYKF
tara:strand:- start:235 stop:501 length:267 start_codon:yes stop_codon:yes gene_type:complete